MKNIRIPAGTIEAARTALGHGSGLIDDIQLNIIVTAVLRYISEHPQVPTDEQVKAILWKLHPCVGVDKEVTPKFLGEFASEWQRRCFVQEEPEIPAELFDLTWRNSTGPAGKVTLTFKEIDDRIFEAYCRGLRKGERE